MTDTVGGSLGDSSLLLQKTQSPFDVREESQVISLLKLVHQSIIEPDIKNHLRDLIFSYRQSPTSVGLQSIFDAFAPLGVSIVKESGQNIQEAPVQIVAETRSADTLGTKRPLPSFAIPKLPSLSPSTETQSKPSTWTLKDVHRDDTKKLHITHTEHTTEPHVDVPEVESVQKTEAPSPVDAVQLQHSDEQDNAVPSVSSASATDRIKEIKRTVNEKVGNPINLIDADNEVGREYMNALLDAMKRSNGGLPQELSAAMQRLEQAFKMVQKNIFPTIAGTGTATHTMPTVKSVPVTESTVNVPAVAGSERTIPASLGGDELPVYPTSTITIDPIVEKQPVVAAVPSQASLADTQRSPIQDIRVQRSNPFAAAETSIADVVRNTPVTKAVDSNGLHSVAKEKQLQDLMRANKEHEAMTAEHQEALRVAAMDPLMVPEIDAGLGQLLSEWNLFKSSGVFGTGPGGKDHPLYKKLAPMPMAAVVAGRFESSTPKIKQNITDTMNGWRYNESILHDPAETFEHYLRKVIRHILDRQKIK